MEAWEMLLLLSAIYASPILSDMIRSILIVLSVLGAVFFIAF